MKRIIAIVIMALMVLVLASCNEAATTITRDYHTAIIKYPNGEVIHIEVSEWASDGASAIIKCNDGTIYRTGWQNVILIGGTEE